MAEILSFIKYTLSNTIFQIPLIQYLLSNTIYQISFIKYHLSNTFLDLAVAKSLQSTRMVSDDADDV